jgi:hypothetical protein
MEKNHQTNPLKKNEAGALYFEYHNMDYYQAEPEH